MSARPSAVVLEQGGLDRAIAVVDALSRKAYLKDESRRRLLYYCNIIISTIKRKNLTVTQAESLRSAFLRSKIHALVDSESSNHSMFELLDSAAGYLKRTYGL